MIVLATSSLHARGLVPEGRAAVTEMAALLGETLGTSGALLFRAGFWAAVVTSLLGVYESVPRLFAETSGLLRGAKGALRERVERPRSPWRLGFLVWLAGPPLLLLQLGRPVGVIVVYAVLGALFMPFLAATLLFLTTRGALIGDALRSRWPGVLALLGCLALFVALGVRELLRLTAS